MESTADVMQRFLSRLPAEAQEKIKAAQEKRDREGDPWPPPIVAWEGADPECPHCQGKGIIQEFHERWQKRRYLGKDPETGEERYEMRPDVYELACKCLSRPKLIVRKSEEVGLTFARYESMTLEEFRADDAQLPSAQWAKIMAWVAAMPQNLMAPDDKTPGWLFHGTAGNGKTHCMVALIHAARLSGIRVQFIREVDLSKQLHATYDPDNKESEARIIDGLSQVPLLAIDDLGKAYVPGHADPAQGNAWLASRLYAILDERLMAARPTIITTNLDDARLLRRLGDALMDRVDMLTRVEFKGESQR